MSIFHEIAPPLDDCLKLRGVLSATLAEACVSLTMRALCSEIFPSCIYLYAHAWQTSICQVELPLLLLPHEWLHCSMFRVRRALLLHLLHPKVMFLAALPLKRLNTLVNVLCLLRAECCNRLHFSACLNVSLIQWWWNSMWSYKKWCKRQTGCNFSSVNLLFDNSFCHYARHGTCRLTVHARIIWLWVTSCSQCARICQL